MELFDFLGAESQFRHSTLLQVLIILGVVLVTAGLAFIWAIFIRKPSRRRRKYHKHDRKAVRVIPPATAGKAPALPDEGNQGRTRRRSRRNHRPMNPTLAETRGLPPVRQDQSISPPPY
jgi:uncharacterized membrane protein YciS (DUF1049 family)